MTDAGARVLVVEDSVLLREGLIRLLTEAGHRVVGAYGDAHDLPGRLRADGAEVALLDVRLPPTHRDEGVRAARGLRAALPGTPVLLLSQYVETVYAAELLADGAGAVGYLLKDRVSSVDELGEAIARVRDGGTVIDPQVVAAVLTTRRDPLAALTARERDVLAAMAAGRTNRAIAAAQHVGVGAVEKHVTAIFGKLGLADGGDEHRRVLAVLRFLGLTEPGDQGR